MTTQPGLNEARTVRATGTVRCYRYANIRRSRNMLGNLIADMLAPLPPHEIWVIEVPDERARDGYRLYRMKSGRRPISIGVEAEGQEVAFVARVQPWQNGLGAYMSAVKLLEWTAPPTAPERVDSTEALVHDD